MLEIYKHKVSHIPFSFFPCRELLKIIPVFNSRVSDQQLLQPVLFSQTPTSIALLARRGKKYTPNRPTIIGNAMALAHFVFSEITESWNGLVWKRSPELIWPNEGDTALLTSGFGCLFFFWLGDCWQNGGQWVQFCSWEPVWKPLLFWIDRLQPEV